MSYIKYAIYAGAVFIVALLFEQIMTGLYNVTLTGAAGDIGSLIILAFFWMALYIVGRAYLDKKVHKNASQFTLFAGLLHVGGTLGIFFYQTDPIYLLTFPVLFVIAVWVRRNSPKDGGNWKIRFRSVHPEFIDDRGGVCVVRSGGNGFNLVKFIEVTPPLPVRELLMFFFHQQIECTFESLHMAGQSVYFLGVVARGRRYDENLQRILTQASKIRQFLKTQQVGLRDVGDCLNAQRTFYAPYFLTKPAPVDEKGHPSRFPEISHMENRVVVTESFSERTFTVHAIKPSFQANGFYPFLNTLKEDWYLRLYMHPLDDVEITLREEHVSEEYRNAIRRLSDGLEDNAEFQAASYLFSQVGAPQKENIEPLLDRDELSHLGDVKRELKSIKSGRQHGLWNIELHLCGSEVLAQTLRIKVDGTSQLLAPNAIGPILSRQFLSEGRTINSKSLFHLLPHHSALITNQIPSNRA